MSQRKLIGQLKSAIDTVNRCSEALAKDSVYIYLKTTPGPDRSDRIELSDIILHQSLLNDKDENDAE